MSKPKIRFKGYEEDWEQRKLSDITLKIGSGKTPSGGKNAYVDDGIPLIRSQNINNDRVDLEDIVFIDEETDNSMENSRVFTDDVLLNITGASIGRSAVYRGKDKANVNQHVCIIRPTKDFDSDFIQLNLASNFGQKQIDASQAGGGREGLNFQEIGKMSFMFPSNQEQMKIGVYFNHIDYLITLHQRKCEETKKLKKYMLQKMFPQNGKRVPEIRFVGFTEDWEQRKLGDIAEFSKGSGYSKGDLIESGTPIILYGRLYTKYETSISEVDTYVEAKDGSVYSKGGEVIVPASGETAEDIARAATVDKSGVILGGDLNVVSPNEDINSAFLAISISHGNSQRELAKKAQGKSIVHIHNEEIKNLVVPFPTKAEQNKIVEYLSSLDNLITLHQRKYEELQKIKKFMLQNMFI